MDNSLKQDKKIKFSHSRNQEEGGFTLLELAIVMIITGIMISLMATALLAYMRRAELQKTLSRMEVVQEAIERYVDVNGVYPCAASRTLGPENTNFGRAIASGPPGAQCGTVAAAGSGTASNGGVRIGAIPVRDLNLPDEFIADAWGKKFTYAVTENLATPGSFVANGGRVRIRDTAGNSVVFPNDSAHYIIVSHGVSGHGAFPITASNNPSTPCGASLDSENCNNNRLFLSTLVNSDVTGGNFYDDYMRFKGQTVPVFAIPPGSVMPFNLAACPGGWSPFLDARGRFIVGARTPQSMNRYNMIIGTLAPTDVDFTFGQVNDGEAAANIPPFVALLYCEKD